MRINCWQNIADLESLVNQDQFGNQIVPDLKTGLWSFLKFMKGMLKLLDVKKGSRIGADSGR